MMAYMSEAGGHRRCVCTDLTYSERTDLSDAAVREAERILAETEAPAFEVETYNGRTWRTPVTQHVSIIGASGHGIAAYCAEALAAILSVLDELALDASGAAYEADVECDGDYWHEFHTGMLDRNRAALAAMDRR